MLEKKTYNELMDEALYLIPRNTDITNVNPGGIARSLLEIQNRQLAKYYDTLEVNHALGFLSETKGEYLDLIGQMMDCQREPEEGDENYRYRISQKVNTAAKANKMAIRLGCLSVDGVRDIKMKRWVQGTGSFAVYVISEEGIVSDELLERVQKKIDEVQAYGNKGIAVKPNEIKLEMKVRITYSSDTTEVEKRNVALDARRNLRKYIQNLSIGEDLIINEAIERVMNTSNQIKNMNIYHLSLRGRPVLLSDQTVYWDEIIVESDKPNSVYVS
jgi:uncharacterized phage protein gp47/JayE